MTKATPETLDHTTQSEISIKSPLPLRVQGTPQKGDRKSVRAREQVPLNQLSKAYMNSERWSSMYTGVYQVLFIYVIAFSFVLSWDCWVCEWVDLWSCVFFFFSFLVVCLFQLHCDDHVLSYPTIFVLFLYLRSLLFLMNDGKGVNLDGREGEK